MAYTLLAQRIKRTFCQRGFSSGPPSTLRMTAGLTNGPFLAKSLNSFKSSNLLKSSLRHPTMNVFQI